MKNVLIFVMTFLMTASVWACDYTISLGAISTGSSSRGICVDEVSFQQLNENYYQVRFSNYFPGTKISYQKMNFHFNGKKEFMEKDIMTLDKILRTHHIGDLYFSYERGFEIIPRLGFDEKSNPSILGQVDKLKPLMNEINFLVH